MGVFALIYSLLLPLGGFRSYRANIIRYDTIMPVTLGLIFVFGITSFYLIKNISQKYKKIYILSIIILLSIFTNADRLNTQPYKCERGALETLARATENIVVLDCNCPVMDWRIITDYKLSDLNAQLFYYWNITREKKLYYHDN